MDNSHLEACLNWYGYTQAFKEKIVLEVVYQGKPIQRAVEEYDLPSTYTLQMWIRQFQKQLENGMIVLPPMTEQQKEYLKASEQRIKELEKALEYANVVIFSLNHLIDFAEKELQVPIRKRVVPNSKASERKRACKDECRSPLHACLVKAGKLSLCKTSIL
jgi:transposase-like protein